MSTSRWIDCVGRSLVDGYLPHNTCCPVCHSCLWRPLPSYPQLQYSSPSILTLRVACTGEASDAHRRIPGPSAAIFMVPQWPAASFSMTYMCHISHPWTPKPSSTTTEEGNGWVCCWPLEERAMICLAPEDLQSQHLQVSCSGWLCRHDKDVQCDRLIHNSSCESTTNLSSPTSTLLMSLIW